MRCKFCGILIAMLALASTATAAPKPPHVRATLLADVKQIVPGKPFHLGVLLSIDPGWHTYWLNPGDSGEATKIKLILPTGFTAGDLQFPTPIKIADPGGINVYGYTDSVMFIATVTPDKSLAPGEADLSAKVSYLVCNNICVPGHATVDLKLPMAKAGDAPIAANGDLFDAWTKQLPVPPQQTKLISDFTQVLFDPVHRTLRLAFVTPLSSKMSTKDFQVFPGPNDDVTVASSFEPAELSGWIFIKLHIDPLAGRQMPSIELPLVVGFEADHVRRGIITQIDLSKLKRADSSPPHS